MENLYNLSMSQHDVRKEGKMESDIDGQIDRLRTEKLVEEHKRLLHERSGAVGWEHLMPHMPGYKYGAYIEERLAEVNELLGKGRP